MNEFIFIMKTLLYHCVGRRFGVALLALWAATSMPSAWGVTGKLLNVSCQDEQMSSDLSYSGSTGSTDFPLVYIADGASLASVDHDISLSITYTYQYQNCSAIWLAGSESSMGDLEAGSTITVTGHCNSSSYINYVTGIHSEKGAIGDIDGDIIVSATGHTGAYGIFINGAGSVGTIRGDIEVSTAYSTVTNYGIRFYNSVGVQTIEFGNGASIVTSAGDEVGVAISNTAGLVLKLEDGACSSDGFITLRGDLVTTAGNITFESGAYDVTSSSWNAKEIYFNQAANVTLTADFGTSSAGRVYCAADLYFAVDSDLDAAMLTVTEGTYLSSVDTVTVALSDSMVEQYGCLLEGEDWDLLDLGIIAISEVDAIACFEDTEFVLTNADGSVVYASGLSYSDCGFTGGVAYEFVSVPEPSTATLSLLALAALLARRRRRV